MSTSIDLKAALTALGMDAAQAALAIAAVETAAKEKADAVKRLANDETYAEFRAALAEVEALEKVAKEAVAKATKARASLDSVPGYQEYIAANAPLKANGNFFTKRVEKTRKNVRHANSSEYTLTVDGIIVPSFAAAFESAAKEVGKTVPTYSFNAREALLRVAKDWAKDYVAGMTFKVEVGASADTIAMVDAFVKLGAKRA